MTTTKKIFPVLGMSCASCAINVENILKMQNGVLQVAVNFANSTVTVEYNPSLIQTTKMKIVIQEAGYDLMIEDHKDKQLEVEKIQAKNFQKLKQKTIWALVLSVPIVIIGMFFMDIKYANEIMWILSTPVVLYFGKDFFIQAWKQASHRTANMDTLVALSTGIAYLFSVFNTLFPHFLHSKGLHSHVYFEAASVIIGFILLGKLLEEKAKGNTTSAIKKLMGLQPKTVTIIKDEQAIEIPIEHVQIGDLILVKPGEKMAVDGIVIDGSSYVDESMLSGEPIPVFKEIKSNVFAGTINQKGSFTFTAKKIGSDTMLAHIIKAVQEAQGSKAPVQQLVDKVAAVFVPVVIGIATLSFIVWYFASSENAF
ncbi:MAG TPA: HAD-IC family P-type ATPase, partial [Chitinophagales bacterium]|nr:HAD-IC family P-type ATPase [Chitinophagales bacterium]